jgi:subtilisin family serine protease
MNKKFIKPILFLSLIIFAAFLAIFFVHTKNTKVVQKGEQAIGGGLKHEASLVEGVTGPNIVPDKNPKPTEKNDSFVITFNSNQAKAEFIKQNNLSSEKVIQIGQSNSYKINSSKDGLNTSTPGSSVSPNVIYRASATPNDPLYSLQWNLSKVSAPAGWDITKGLASVNVAVIDGGFALNHEDLIGKFDIANAYDYVHNDSSPNTGQDNPSGAGVSHATIVSGLVGATTDNSKGVAGIGWNIGIIPIQALDDDGVGDTGSVASGIYRAVSGGAKVINMSLGSPSDDPVLKTAVDYAINNGVTVVAAAANDGCNCIEYPANYPAVIAVGATDANDVRASFSNYGSNLDLVAPGSGTLRSTSYSAANPTSLYTTTAYGTSFSSPMVAGAAALIKSAKVNSSPNEISNFLARGTDKVVSMSNQNFTQYYGYGRLNIQKSLSLVSNPNISWNFESLDGSATSVSGQDGAFGQTPRAIQFGTSIQVFYYDVTNGNLKRSYENGSGWVTETLDGAGGTNGRINADVGKMPATAIYNNQLHVFYFDVTNGDLRHGVSDTNGGNWTFETLDGDSQTGGRTTAKVGVNPTVAVYGNTLQVFHYDDTAGNLRHAWFTPGTGWSNENLDGDPGSVGRANANLGEDPEVVIYNNEIQLYYYDLTYGNLRHAWTTTRGWAFENLDGDPGSVGRSNSNLGRNPSVTIHNGQLQLFYYDIQYGNLRHAWTTTKGWAFENIDGDTGAIFGRNKNTGVTPKVISYNNVLYLFYYDQTDGELRYAYADNTGWHNYSLDGKPESISAYTTANTGIDPAVISMSGELQLFYYNFTSSDLTHAWLKI